MILRRDVNRPLTHDEVDDNFVELKNDTISNKEDLIQASSKTLAEYPTLADALADDIPDGVVFIVNDGDDAGYWRRDSNAPEGTRFVRKDFDKKILGIDTIPEGTNIIEDVLSTDLEDEEIWATGMYTEDGGTTGWTGAKRFLKYVRAYPGDYVNNLYARSNSYVHAYDKDYNFIDAVQSVGGIGGTITLPEGTEYIRFSHILSEDLSELYLNLTHDVDVLTDEKVATPETVEDAIDALNPKFDAKIEPSDVGIIRIEKGTDILEAISQTDINNTDIWGSGYLRADGEIRPTEGLYYTKELIPAYPGEYDALMYESGSSVHWVYDEKEVLIDTVQSSGGTLHLPEGTAFIRISVDLRDIYDDNRKLSDIYLRIKENYDIVTNDVFLKKEILDDDSGVATKKNVGIRTFTAGDNIFPILDPVNFSDTDVWGVGFVRGDGSIGGGDYWRHSKELLPIPKGVYTSNVNVTGSAAVVLLSSDGTVYEAFQNPSGEYSINVPFEGMFLRLSVSENSNGQVRYVRPDTDVTVVTDDVFTTPEYVLKRSYAEIVKVSMEPKSTPPVVTFIADDGTTETLNWFVPLFRERNCFATIAPIGSRIGGSSAYLDAEQLKELYDEGFDIANHTWRHERDLSEEEYDKSVYDGRLYLESLGMSNPVVISPFGEGGFRLKIFKKYHSCNFITINDTLTGVDVVNLPPINTFALKRVSFDAAENGVSTLDRCKSAVDAAVTHGGMLAFAVHPNYGEYTASGNPDGYLQRRNDLEELIDYIQGLGIPILTAKKAFEFYKNPIDIGIKNNDGVPPYYSLGMDGSEEGNYFNT